MDHHAHAWPSWHRPCSDHRRRNLSESQHCDLTIIGVGTRYSPSLAAGIGQPKTTGVSDPNQSVATGGFAATRIRGPRFSRTVNLEYASGRRKELAKQIKCALEGGLAGERKVVLGVQRLEPSTGDR
jgi:hypothetical protein